MKYFVRHDRVMNTGNQDEKLFRRERGKEKAFTSIGVAVMESTFMSLSIVCF